MTRIAPVRPPFAPAARASLKTILKLAVNPVDVAKRRCFDAVDARVPGKARSARLTAPVPEPERHFGEPVEIEANAAVNP